MDRSQNQQKPSNEPNTELFVRALRVSQLTRRKRPATHAKLVDRVGSGRAAWGRREMGAHDVHSGEGGQRDGDNDEQDERRDEEENADSPVKTGHPVLMKSALDPRENEFVAMERWVAWHCGRREMVVVEGQGAIWTNTKWDRAFLKEPKTAAPLALTLQMTRRDRHADDLVTHGGCAATPNFHLL